MSSREPKHWILLVGNGTSFLDSEPHKLWGIESRWKTFLRTARPGDILWFVINDSHGKAMRVATFVGHRPLPDDIRVWLGWSDKYDTAIDYMDSYNLSKCSVLTRIRNQTSVRIYDPRSGSDVLPEEYRYIVKYCSAVKI